MQETGSVAATSGAGLARRFDRSSLWQGRIEEHSCVLLIVPSVVTAGRDGTLVANPGHPDAARIPVGPEILVALDPRLFGR
jgi:hypothetical protein